MQTSIHLRLLCALGELSGRRGAPGYVICVINQSSCFPYAR